MRNLPYRMQQFIRTIMCVYEPTANKTWWMLTDSNRRVADKQNHKKINKNLFHNLIIHVKFNGFPQI